MELSGPTLKKAIIFSQRKLFLYFGKWNLLKKTSYVLGGDFMCSQNKKKTHIEKNSENSGNGTL